MKILALDISTKTGWALFQGDNLLEYGKLLSPINDFNVNDKPEKAKSYPWNILKSADKMADDIWFLYSKFKPDFVVVENTVKGRNRSTQRALEWIHKSLVDLFDYPQDKSKFHYMDPSEWRKILEIRLSNEQKKNNRLVTTGKKRGKITKKHLSTNFANQRFNLKLKLKDNDQADAICLGFAFYTLLNGVGNPNVPSNT